jgi:hypothetical protein
VDVELAADLKRPTFGEIASPKNTLSLKEFAGSVVSHIMTADQPPNTLHPTP